MIFKYICIFLIVAISQGTCDEKKLIHAIEKYFSENAKKDPKQQFSGTFLLSKDNQVIFQKANGLASYRFNYPNQINTKFCLASVSKLFTSVAVAQLVEQGKLKLSDPVSKYLDESWLPLKKLHQVNIHQLLIHASGLGDFFSHKDYKNRGSSGGFLKVEHYKNILGSESLRFPPGESQVYSNLGYILLGAIIESVSGMDYYSYVQEYIFDKANMKDSGFYRMDRPEENLAIGYIYKEIDGKSTLFNNLYSNAFMGSPAGGAYSTVHDLLKFSKAIDEHVLLSAHYTEEILSKTISRPKPEEVFPSSIRVFEETYYGDFTKYGFAGAWNDYGFAVWENPIAVGHNGGTLGVDNYYGMFLDNGYTLIILSNLSNGEKSKLVKHIIELMGYEYNGHNL